MDLDTCQKTFTMSIQVFIIGQTSQLGLYFTKKTISFLSNKLIISYKDCHDKINKYRKEFVLHLPNSNIKNYIYTYRI